MHGLWGGVAGIIAGFECGGDGPGHFWSRCWASSFSIALGRQLRPRTTMCRLLSGAWRPVAYHDGSLGSLEVPTSEALVPCDAGISEPTSFHAGVGWFFWGLGWWADLV